MPHPHEFPGLDERPQLHLGETQGVPLGGGADPLLAQSI
jgi:hypothetical protein